MSLRTIYQIIFKYIRPVIISFVYCVQVHVYSSRLSLMKGFIVQGRLASVSFLRKIKEPGVAN